MACLILFEDQTSIERGTAGLTLLYSRRFDTSFRFFFKLRDRHDGTQPLSVEAPAETESQGLVAGGQIAGAAG